MKLALLLLFVASCALASDVPKFYNTYKVADKEWLKWQKSIFTLFKNVHQPSWYKEHLEISQNFKFETYMPAYSNATAVQEFLYYYKMGMLPKDAIFSVFYEEHLKEAIGLFKVFYYAKDFETFYKTAVWARNNVNFGTFVYALSVAIVHRPDTYGMILPPIYEIYPHYFFSSEVIHKAQKYKQYYYGDSKYTGQVIPANYTGWYLNVHPEQSLSYFTEDVGINSYYYYYNLYYPFWFKSEGFQTKYPHRGEQFFYFYQQLMARYYLARLSHDFGEIPMFNWDAPFEVGYTPSLTYHNGMHFPDRPNYVSFMSNYYNYAQSHIWKGKYPYSYTYVKDFERRIRDAIDSGFVYTHEGQKVDIYTPGGFEILGNLIESNPSSPDSHYYGAIQVFARYLLGYSFQPLHPYKVAPSALQHFETSLRDPAFWMFYNRMMVYFYKYKYNLPYYSYKDLYFPGVKVEGFSVDPLITYFDYFTVDLTNAVYMNPQEFQSDSFSVYAKQYRLNHKPFTYKVNVAVEKPVKAVFRVFIGPKYDEYGRKISIHEKRHYFVEFDKFVYELQAGHNTVMRNSDDFFYADDYTTYKDMYQWVMGGYNGQTEFKWFNGSYAYYGFPHRFLLPKGKVGGQTYQFYVIATPYEGYSTDYETTQPWQYPMFGTWTYYVDKYPLGYPFDRKINEGYFYVPNSYFYDVKIYHEHFGDYSYGSHPTSYTPETKYSSYPSYPSYPTYPTTSKFSAYHEKYPEKYYGDEKYPHTYPEGKHTPYYQSEGKYPYHY